MELMFIFGINKSFQIICMTILSVCSVDAKIDNIYRGGGKYSTAGRWEGWKNEEDYKNGYLKAGFIFPNLKRLNEKSGTKTVSKNKIQLWPSYPPPLPLWALSKPRRDFHPYFGKLSITQNPTVITSSPTQPPIPSTTQSIPSSTTQPSQPITCRPDPVTDNLPWDCIDIIQALRDNAVFEDEDVI
eukprot:TRINITY_DN33898_c0_g1_i1.p1 TRINITY_DN33898_c0_g1~~TRINITY_DN33898_c0_g1_i1.p1  ORF type:complete len:186 (-),score=40.12 TRINITY_DN33898_c0_g1_i1:90-647(-)